MKKTKVLITFILIILAGRLIAPLIPFIEASNYHLIGNTYAAKDGRTVSFSGRDIILADSGNSLKGRYEIRGDRITITVTSADALGMSGLLGKFANAIGGNQQQTMGFRMTANSVSLDGEKFSWRSGDNELMTVVNVITIIALAPFAIVLLVIFLKSSGKRADTVKRSPQAVYIPPAQNISTPASTVKCSGCGQMIAADVVFCHHCGTKHETQPTTALCSSCGRATDANAAFCRNCGAKRDSISVHSHSTPASTVTCPGCGKTIESKSAFCRFCGAKRI